MKAFDRRLRFLSVIIILFALVLIAKLYLVQVVSGASFKAKADHQYVEGANYFDRGSIFFTSKDGTLVPAASIKTGYILAIDPEIFAQNAADVKSIYDKVNAITPVDSSLFDQKAAATSSSYAELAKKLPVEIADQIQNLSIPGVSVYAQQWRVYPGGSMAAHVVGFEAYGSGDASNQLAGRYGLERYYEPVLARSGDDTFVNFFAEMFSDIKKTVSPGQSLEGDIVTTIEPSVEAFLEEEIQGVQDQYHSEFTGGIVIDPNTGEIYAMALTPTFDPNDPQAQASSAVFTNNSVEDRYEMGSIFKALTMASGIDSGAVTPTSTYNDPGCVTLDKKTFCNYDNKSHGQNLPMQIILDESLNTGAAYVEQQMGNATFSKYMLSFGIGSTTGIDLPNEGNSLVSHLTSGDDLEYAEASFGQGIAVTPIQAARAFSVLANGGHLITPHLVKEIDYDIGTKKIIDPGQGPQILKSTTIASISRMLTEVVDVALENGAVKLQNYSIAAKTGTAQIANPAGGYYSNHYVHSFFGYFPSYKPRFLIFLYTYYPKNVLYASETLTPSFMNMAKFLINYYNIPPDRTAPPPPTALCANNDC
jgi:cell division protein FtsI (penicillin-binding protein 3)/stage V sporulation protein D (sporulation-specific penicillin-binding protein)